MSSNPNSLLSTAIVLATAITWTACAPSSSAPSSQKDLRPQVVLAKASEVITDKTLPVLGTLFAKDEATLSAEVEGKLERTLAELGDRVRDGQELALIDTSSYEAELAKTEALLKQARSVAANAEAQLTRIQALAGDGIAAPSDLDQARAVHEEARSGVQASEASLAIAKIRLEKSRVRAPFDAAIAERIASAGDFVRPGSPLFRIVNDQVLKFVVQVPERYSGQIQRGQTITFSVDAWPGETFTGSVFLISPAVNTATRAFSLGALVDNKDGRLKASTFARGQLVLQKDAKAVTVPLEAVVQSAGISRVYVVESGVARTRTVQTGRVLNGLQEVISGLSPGQEVIVSGHARLVDGSQIRVREAQTQPPRD